MSDGADSINALDAARERLKGQIEVTRERLSTADLNTLTDAKSPGGTLHAMRALRDSDRDEAHVDSRRQFHWLLSLAQAAVGHAPSESSAQPPSKSSAQQTETPELSSS